MTESAIPSISIKERFDLEAKPDVALIKFNFAGEGLTMEDAVANAGKKVGEAREAFRTDHSAIQSIAEFDVYFGQKEDGLRAEPQAFPRPLVVQGLLITANPEDQAALFRIIDDGIKRGAVLNSPHRRSYMSNALDSALLFGLVDSEQCEQAAVERCLKNAEHRSRATASSVGKTVGKLIRVSDVIVEPRMPQQFKVEYAHIRRSFPTGFLSPTPQNVLLCASLVATYELAD